MLTSEGATLHNYPCLPDDNFITNRHNNCFILKIKHSHQIDLSSQESIMQMFKFYWITKNIFCSLPTKTNIISWISYFIISWYSFLLYAWLFVNKSTCIEAFPDYLTLVIMYWAVWPQSIFPRYTNRSQNECNSASHSAMLQVSLCAHTSSFKILIWFKLFVGFIVI